MDFMAVKTESYLGLPEIICLVIIKFTKPFDRSPRRLLNCASLSCLFRNRQRSSKRTFMNYEEKLISPKFKSVF